MARDFFGKAMKNRPGSIEINVLIQRTNEREDLRQQIATRVSERDALQGRCERLRKGLQNLLTQDDVPFGATPVSAPDAPAASPAAGGQS